MLGVRCDLISPADFDAMMNFVKVFLPSVHKQTSVDDVVQFVAGQRVPHVAHPSVGAKEPLCIGSVTEI